MSNESGSSSSIEEVLRRTQAAAGITAEVERPSERTPSTARQGEWGGTRSVVRTRKASIAISEWVGPGAEPEHRRALRVDLERIAEGWVAAHADAMRRRAERRAERQAEHDVGGHTYHADCPTCWGARCKEMGW